VNILGVTAKKQQAQQAKWIEQIYTVD